MLLFYNHSDKANDSKLDEMCLIYKNKYFFPAFNSEAVLHGLRQDGW